MKSQVKLVRCKTGLCNNGAKFLLQHHLWFNGSFIGHGRLVQGVAAAAAPTAALKIAAGFLKTRLAREQHHAQPNGLSRDDGKRPDGITLVPWIKGQPLVWDVTVVDTLVNSYVLKTPAVSGFAAEMACKRKHSKYSSIISSNYIFKGLAFETLGPWCKETIDFINVIGNRLIAESGDSKSKKFLFERISLAIQRGNAASIQGTFPDSALLWEIFALGRIVAFREAGLLNREIAFRVDRSVVTVVRICQIWKEERRGIKRRPIGQPRQTVSRQIGDQWFAEEGRPVSMKTIYRRIRSFGLLSYRPRLVLDIVVKDWTEEWHNMVFTDESRFCLGMHSGRRQVRRRRGERPDIEFAFERPAHRTVGVMPIFRQDNARSHIIARRTLQFLNEAGVNISPWPARSPDLNPIEQVWDMIGRRLTILHRPPQTLAQLQHEIQVAWNQVPQAVK
ncbi:hypothetical protein GEV33_012350 [Tenebrio molitor]|uniref:Tc1-like transposase DDE domain-containing protein n=1 Tax=Tenebrio molitor TaxID=7067 RepID=A0A8J6LF71_TENMO|nr:hypothetical protein GEV33_012350 [Tenebrio molitor]